MDNWYLEPIARPLEGTIWVGFHLFSAGDEEDIEPDAQRVVVDQALIAEYREAHQAWRAVQLKLARLWRQKVEST